MKRSILPLGLSGLAILGFGLACSSSDNGVSPSDKTIHDITITPDSAAIPLHTTVAFTAVAHDRSGATVSGVQFDWSASNSAIATVDQNGVATGVDTGQVKIAASAQGVSGFAALAVGQPTVGAVIIVPSSATLRVATTLQLTDTVKDLSGNPIAGMPVTWTSDNATIAAVDGNGLVTARALGVAHISASAGGKTGTAAITISQVPVASVSISPAAPSVAVGQTTQLTATTKDSAGNMLGGRVVRWHSGNRAVAKIDSVTGILTGVAVGSTQISATSEGISASVTATITAPAVASIVVVPGSDTIAIGGQLQLSDTVKDAQGHVLNTSVTWASTSTGVATVSGSGVVTGRSAGAAAITASAGGKTGINTTVVIDTSTAPASITLQVNPDSVVAIPNPLDVLIQLTATVKTVSGRVLSNYPVVYTSSDPTVSGTLGTGPDTVDGGTTAIIPNGNGRTVITATAGTVSAHAPLTVCYAAQPTPICKPLASIQVAPPIDTVPLGDSTQLQAIGVDSSGNQYPGMAVEWDPGQVTAGNFNQVVAVEANGEVVSVDPGTQQVLADIQGFSGIGLVTVIRQALMVAQEPLSEAQRSRILANVARERQQAAAARALRRQQLSATITRLLQTSRTPRMRAYYQRMLGEMQKR